MGTELALEDAVLFEKCLCDDSTDDFPSFEDDEIRKNVTIEFEVVEFLSTVRLEYNLIIVSPESDELASYGKCFGTDAVSETIGIADDPEEEEGRDVFVDFCI